ALRRAVEAETEGFDARRPVDDQRALAVLDGPALASAPAVSVKDDTLCVGGFGFNDRRVTLLKGLPGKGMDTLKENRDLDFTFGEKPSYVGFAGNGVILPREESDGVAVETVNVSSLAFEVWHVSDRNLVRKSVAAPDPVAEGDYDYDWGDDSADDIGVKIWTGKVAVKSGNGERVTTVFPLGAVLKSLKPGAYVIKVKDASGGRDKNQDDQPASARRWVIYTDMAMTTYKGQDGMDVVVRSLKSAKPIAGVKVDLVASNGDTLGSVKTAPDGRVSFNGALLKGTEALQAKMVMAYGPGDDYTAVEVDRTPMDLTSHGVGGRADEASTTDGRAATNGVDGYVYTDRGIYRPGETLHLVALVRDNEGRAIKNRKGALVVYRPSGVEAFRFGFDGTPQGYASANVVLPKTAPRGQWTAKVVLEGLDGDAGHAGFAVEDFAPQRLGVDVKADAQRPLLSLTEKRPVQVAAHYLYGAIGSGLTVTGEARIRLDTNPFPKYQDYQFGDESKPYDEKYVDLPETVTDGQGNAMFPFDASLAGDTDQPLTVLMTASVFEPGGRPVRESQTLKIKSAPLYLGVKTEQKDGSLRDTPKIGFNIIGLTPNGDKVAVKGVKVTLISEIWDYDWYIADGKWHWKSSHHDVVKESHAMDLNNNTGVYFERGLDWGDYRIEVEAPGQAKTVVRFSSGWGSAAKGTDAPDSVRLAVAKSDYAQGDTIDLTLKAPYKGEAQIAVATDHVIDMKTVSVGENGTTVRLKSTAAWGGGAYILVSVIQPRDPVTSSKPRRAVGLIYVPLDPKSRKLQVNVPVSDQPFKPRVDGHGQGYVDVPVEVKGLKLGDKAHVSIAVVDQGILNLTKFKSPNPVDWYFGMRALGVDYNDDYGRLLDPNLGAPAPMEFGGDQLGGEGLTTTPIRTIALWSGVVNTGMDGKALVHLPIAKFNGELKIMTVAWTDEQVGQGEQRIVVREPVVADLALPRFLAPGDRAFATLELDNVDGKPGLYQAVIKGLRGLALAFQKTFNLGHGDRQVELVPMTAGNTTGVSTVQIGLSGQGYKFDDSFDIQTRNGWGPETRVISQLQKPGEVWSPDASVLNGLQPGSVTVEVSYSPFRNIDPSPLATALNKYPYGCTEQVTSAGVPWLYVDEATTGSKVAGPALPAMQKAVNKILDRQSEDGSIGLWRAGDGEADGFIGAYATDFLIEARARGVYVPQEAIDKALSAMRAMAKPDGFVNIGYRLNVSDHWSPYYGITDEQMSSQLRSRASAYALYVLAKSKSGDLARLRWYHDVQFKSEDSPLARAQVAAGLVMMGDRARGRLAFQEAIAKLGYSDPWDWYQSPLRDLAGVIALAYESGEADIARSLIPRLESAMKSPAQMNTQEDAYVMRAASYMLKAVGATKIDSQGVSTLPGGSHVARFGIGAFAPARLKNAGSGAIWRTVTVIGTPVGAPGADSHGLTLSKAFYAMDGSRIDPANMTQGQKVLVVISGHSDRAELRPIVVDDALPAGFEIESTLTSEDAQNGPFRFIGDLSAAKVQEARDDRYIAALDVSSSEGFQLAYIARAVTPGDFYMPGAEAKDFYRADMFGRTQGGRTVIGGR
ncbi:MAG: alpha-2-macroglobulin family protein, partial [Asticcacaulis sp.]|nr:alpha-2-macroglobulin family protein [Asticcacaulis sp.]